METTTYIKNKRSYTKFNCEICNCETECRTDGFKTRKYKRCKNHLKYHSGKDAINYKHGLISKRLYSIFISMKGRCNNKNNSSYSKYGGRGISICKEWKSDVKEFVKWALDNGYSDELTIDRINPDGNYEPSNCRWATKTTQSRNTTRLQKNNNTGYRGVSKSSRSNTFRARIKVNYKEICLGHRKTALECALMYDEYITLHNLEHTKNFTKAEIIAIGWANNEEIESDNS